MEEVGVPEAARALGVSSRRVRQLIDADRVRARQVAGRWLIDLDSLPRSPRRSRPMSPRVAWALIALSEGQHARWLKADEAYRLRAQFDRLASDPNPELLLRSWLVGRGDRLVLSAPVPDELRDDPRLVPSGLSDQRSGMFASSHAEGYVHPDDLEALRGDHLLIPGSRRNVVLHVSEMIPDRPVPLLLLAADLADHDSPRELGRAHELIADTLNSRHR